MGYTTRFEGTFKVEPPLSIEHAKQLFAIYDADLSVRSHPLRTPDMPEYSLQWTPTRTLDGIQWDEGDKFYEYEAWLVWIKNWLCERGYTLSGVVAYEGADPTDRGELRVVEGRVSRHVEPNLGDPDVLIHAMMAIACIEGGVRQQKFAELVGKLESAGFYTPRKRRR